MYVSSTEIQEQYAASYQRLLKQSLRGDGSELNRIFELRHRQVEAFRNCKTTMDWYRSKAANLANAVRFLLSNHERPLCLTRNGREYPVLLNVSILNHPLEKSAAETLLNLNLSPETKVFLQRLFARSSFEEGFLRYRSGRNAEGEPFISGENGANLRSLIGLAHEAGHMLCEKEYLNPDYDVQFESEAIAHQIEEDWVMAYLQDVGHFDLVSAVQKYLQEVDLMNFQFFIEEHDELIGSLNQALSTKYRYCFRESSITAIGYQVYNAHASLLRWEKRNSG